MKKLTAVFIILHLYFISFSQNAKLDSLEKAVLLMPEDTNKVKGYIEVAQIYINIDALKAEKYGKASLQLAQKLKYERGQLVGAVRLYYYLFMQSKYEEAEKVIKAGLALAKESGNIEFEGRLSNSMSQTMMATMELKEALNYGFRALKIGNELDIFRIKKNAMKNIAGAYTYQGDVKKALEYNEMALKYAITKNEIADQAMAYTDLAANYSRLGDFQKSLLNNMRAHKIFVEIGDLGNEITCLNNLAGNYFYLGKLNEGLKYANMLLEKQKGTSLVKEKALTLIIKGMILTSLKQYREAEANLFLAKNLADSTNNIRIKPLLYDGLSNLYYAKNDFVTGRKYSSKALLLRDSLTAVNNNTQVVQMEVKYKAAEKDALLAKSELQSSKRKNWIIGLGLSLVGLFVSGVFYWRITHKNLKIENQDRLILAREVERKRIAKELHDSVGSQLTVVSTSLDNAFYLFEKQMLKPEKLENISDEVRLAAQSLRDTIWATYNTEISVADLKSRIQEFVKKFTDENSFKVELNITGDEVILTPIEGLNLFRIVQEALNNIQKYAEADLVKIAGEFLPTRYYLEIVDNGKGFDLQQIKVNESYGLNNMKTRAEEIGGTLNVLSDFKNGTAIQFSRT